jgi:hypothetical protein
MAAVLNIFRTISVDATTSMTSVYTAPVGYTAVILMAQVSNVTGNTIQVSANVERFAGGSKSLVKNIKIPTEDAIGLLTGRLVLQPGDGFAISASANNSAELILSLLETIAEG